MNCVRLGVIKPSDWDIFKGRLSNRVVPSSQSDIPFLVAPVGVDQNGGEASSVPGGAAALGGVAHCGVTESIVHGHTEVVPQTVVAVQVSPYVSVSASVSVLVPCVPFLATPNVRALCVSRVFPIL